MSNAIKTAVVILNWNGLKFLKQFLPQVVACTNIADAEVWVADNGSTDGSLPWITDNFPTVKQLAFDKNYGFTGGYNKALQQIDAQYFVLLNSDIDVTPGWLQPLIGLMDTDPTIAACMPKLRAYNDKDKFEYAGAAGGFIDFLGYPFCRGRILNVIEPDKGQYDNLTEVFWATGACMVVRANLFNEVGGLDDDFFAHMEEIDLCWRFKNLGYKIMFVPNSTIYHVGGGTLPNNNPRKLYLNFRNSLFLLYKNLPKGQFRHVLLVRMMLDGLAALVYLLHGQFSFFGAVFKAHRDFYKMLPLMRTKRAALNKMRKVKIHPQMFKRSIVVSHFIRKRRVFSDLSENGWL